MERLKFAATFWAGLLVGVSFLATPVKFETPSLTRPVALDVGRTTFHLMNKVELGLAVVLVVLAALVLRRSRGERLLAALVGAIVIIVLAQTFWLIPELDVRVEAIIDGQDLESSPLHFIYVAAEVIKLGALLAIVFVARPRAAAAIR